MGKAQIINHGLHRGQMLKEVTLQSDGLSLSLLNFGAVTRDLRLTAKGEDRPLILGFADPAAYLDNPAYLGVIAGRVANRIKNAQFALGGQHYYLDANEGNNQLHGGPKGLSHVIWELEPLSAASARLSYHSPDGENGFPGAVDFTVVVTLDAMSVDYQMSATVDRPTPINMAQHNYYNLMGGGQPIWDHRLQVDAIGYLAVDDTNVPYGEIAPPDGTRYDLRMGQSLGDLDRERLGTDINVVFDDTRDPALPVAILTAPDGLRMTVTTEQPGAQVYTAMMLPAQGGGLSGQTIGPGMGLCFEPQGHANAVNQPDFPSVIVTPDKPYVQNLRLDFGWG
ncbi:aldose epimerase family protein [Phaeobacter sp. HF9A]|uniref:aldose epimerase family protein n=1 Tax=Phaeobacter sp. HF9A TaxID=2721561 RepID=UPI001430B850|nr:aldose epimerase family protein [Phaeobacter sp. HF9A]NIZ12179.1 galactose mutarotase [Phaeobacter sp. HF9A]